MEYVFSHLRIDEYQKLTKTLGNLKKMQILSKNDKIRDIKMLKTIPLLLETMQCPIKKPQKRLSGPWSWKNWKLTKIFKNLKMQILSKKKSLKFVIFKSWNLFHDN